MPPAAVRAGSGSLPVYSHRFTVDTDTRSIWANSRLVQELSDEAPMLPWLNSAQNERLMWNCNPWGGAGYGEEAGGLTLQRLFCTPSRGMPELPVKVFQKQPYAASRTRFQKAAAKIPRAQIASPIQHREHARASSPGGRGLGLTVPRCPAGSGPRVTPAAPPALH